MTLPVLDREGLHVTVRPFSPADEDVIYGPWLAAYHKSPVGSLLEQRAGDVVWRQGQRWVIARLLKSTACIVACNVEDPGQVFGWIVGESDPHLGVVTLHFSYVKGYMRGRGVGRLLFQALSANQPDAFQVFYTHDDARLPKKKPDWSFNPFLLMR